MTGKQRRNPTRTCVACRQAGGKRGLLRVARTPEGLVVYDRSGRAPGRGAYLHPDPECIALARRRRAIERSMKAQIPDAVWADLTAAIEVDPQPGYGRRKAGAAVPADLSEAAPS